MTGPIAPLLPINPVIFIQPVSTQVSGQDTSPQNLLSLLADGANVRGFVVNRDSKNNPIVRTASGDIVVQSDVFIKTGSEVVFRVDTNQPSLARIITIDEQTPETYSAQNLRTALAEDTIATPQLSNLGQASAPRSGQPSTPLPLLQSVVLQALTTSQSQTLPRALQQLPPGTPLNLTVFDVHLPPIPVSLSSLTPAANLPGLLPQQASTNPQAAVPSSIAAPLAAAFFAFDKAQNLTNTSPAPPAPFSAGMPQTLQTAPANTPAPQLPQGALPPTPGMAAPLTAQNNNAGQTNAGNTFQATIIGHGEDGSNIVNTPFASLKVYTAQPLPSGTTLTLSAEVTTPSAPIIATPFPANATPPTNLPLPPSFQYLAPALNQLMAVDPAMAREFMQQLPVVGPRFTSGLLFFLAAVKNGERRNVFNAIEIGRLDAAVPGLLSQLAKDMRELHQSFTNSPFDEWKPVHLPLVFGSATENARLYIRREQEDSGNAVEKISGSNRFLLDLDLSELGQMQLDGFIRQNPNGKSLELFLRSAEPLETTISGDIRTLFLNATEATGMAGNIVFQPGAEHFVKPQPKPPAGPSDAGPHTILA